MIDITDIQEELNYYGGSELKASYNFNGKNYMVKFPDPVREKNREISYITNQYSEYIGCSIFKTIGIETQDTMLVKKNVNGKIKIAVACENFLKEDETLIEMEFVALSLSMEKKYDTSINDVYEMIDILDSKYGVNKDLCLNRFWDMFVVDALIGNPDRHLGNWGFIKNGIDLKIAPIYDCGSSLSPLLELDEIHNVLNNPSELKNVSYNVSSIYKIDGKRIFYRDIFKKPPFDLKCAINRIVPKIDMVKIKKIIDDIESLNEDQKSFYYKSILIRKEQILDQAYNSLMN